jgi:hypothetical protein
MVNCQQLTVNDYLFSNILTYFLIHVKRKLVNQVVIKNTSIHNRKRKYQCGAGEVLPPVKTVVVNSLKETTKANVSLNFFFYFQ